MNLKSDNFLGSHINFPSFIIFSADEIEIKILKTLPITMQTIYNFQVHDETILFVNNNNNL